MTCTLGKFRSFYNKVSLQENIEIEKRLSAELQRERERFIREKTNSTADYEELKKTLEEQFVRDKTNFEKNFARQKLKLEQTVDELRQVFTKGEEGLKGKLKDDFVRLVSEHKNLLDRGNKNYEREIETLLDQSEKSSEAVKKLKIELSTMKEKHQMELEEKKTRYCLYLIKVYSISI